MISNNYIDTVNNLFKDDTPIESILIDNTPLTVTPGQNDELNQRNVKIIKDSWSKIEQMGLQKFGIVLFKKLFTHDPELLKLFPFKDEANLYQSDRFKSHSLKVT